MCPFEAKTSYSEPRYFLIVFAFAGDSTTTSVFAIKRTLHPASWCTCNVFLKHFRSLTLLSASKKSTWAFYYYVLQGERQEGRRNGGGVEPHMKGNLVRVFGGHREPFEDADFRARERPRKGGCKGLYARAVEAGRNQQVGRSTEELGAKAELLEAPLVAVRLGLVFRPGNDHPERSGEHARPLRGVARAGLERRLNDHHGVGERGQHAVARQVGRVPAAVPLGERPDDRAALGRANALVEVAARARDVVIAPRRRDRPRRAAGVERRFVRRGVDPPRASRGTDAHLFF